MAQVKRRSLQFDINRLDREPQSSLQAVHTLLYSGISSVESQLEQVQRAYYAPDRNILDHLSSWGGVLRPVMANSHLNATVSGDVMDDVFRRQVDPDKAVFVGDIAALNRMRECVGKVSDAAPGKFKSILHQMTFLLKNLQKYCVSFYDLEKDVLLETAKTYELQRQSWIESIMENVGSVELLAERFRTSGLGLDDLSPYAVELARRADCSHAPFLLLVPESCENIKIALMKMRAWITDDASYAGYLENDIRDLRRRKKTALKHVRLLRQAYHQLTFRCKHSQVECERLTIELKKIQEREDQLTVADELLTTETNDLQTEVETTEFRRQEVTRNSALFHPEALYEKYNELSERLREMKERLPVAQQELTAVRHKLRWIGEKRSQLKEELKKMESLRAEREDTARQLEEYEVEFDGAVVALTTAKRILLCKGSSDAVEKIFYNNPVQINTARLPGGKHSQEAFDKACRFVARNIDGDWPVLYRALPFYPDRGVNTIDEDIHELSTQAGQSDVALRALSRWRRHHTRASLDDLGAALTAIRRPQVLRQMNFKVHPRPPDTVVLSEVPDWVEPELIPYWREVERFDQLRAANKI